MTTEILGTVMPVGNAWIPELEMTPMEIKCLEYVMRAYRLSGKSNVVITIPANVPSTENEILKEYVNSDPFIVNIVFSILLENVCNRHIRVDGVNDDLYSIVDSMEVATADTGIDVHAYLQRLVDVIDKHILHMVDGSDNNGYVRFSGVPFISMLTKVCRDHDGYLPGVDGVSIDVDSLSGYDVDSGSMYICVMIHNRSVDNTVNLHIPSPLNE